MNPEWGQKASYGLEKRETYGVKHQLCQASVIIVKRQVKAVARAWASQRPCLPGVQEEPCWGISGNVLMVVATPLTHGLIKQLQHQLTIWSTFCVTRDKLFLTILGLCILGLEMERKVEIRKMKDSTYFKPKLVSWNGLVLQGSHGMCIFLSPLWRFLSSCFLL